MQSRTTNFGFGPNFSIDADNVFLVKSDIDIGTLPPIVGLFELLNGTPFLLLDGTNFLLL